MTATRKKATNPRTGANTLRRTKYAKARIAAGLKYSDLQRLGFGRGTIHRADAGKLPRHAATRSAYMRAIGLGEGA